MKEITITVPDDCELKQDGNTYTIVEKEKKLTYEDIAKKMFPYGAFHYYIQSDGNIYNINNAPSNYKLPNTALSKRQLEKLLAINMLMNVAKHLNGNWQPNWHDCNERKFYIYYDNSGSGLRIECNTSDQNNFVYFKLVELAKKAIEILGEETIKLALCTDY